MRDLSQTWDTIPDDYLDNNDSIFENLRFNVYRHGVIDKTINKLTGKDELKVVDGDRILALDVIAHLNTQYPDHPNFHQMIDYLTKVSSFGLSVKPGYKVINIMEDIIQDYKQLK